VRRHLAALSLVVAILDAAGSIAVGVPPLAKGRVGTGHLRDYLLGSKGLLARTQRQFIQTRERTASEHSFGITPPQWLAKPSLALTGSSSLHDCLRGRWHCITAREDLQTCVYVAVDRQARVMPRHNPSMESYGQRTSECKAGARASGANTPVPTTTERSSTVVGSSS
jgi:hypothetical protein